MPHTLDQTAQPHAPEQYLSVKDVVAMLDISRSTLFVWISQGKFPRPDFKPSRRVIRFRRSNVEAWIAANRPRQG